LRCWSDASRRLELERDLALVDVDVEAVGPVPSSVSVDRKARTTMRKIALALSVLALVAAGCGGDDEEEPAESTPAPAETGTPSEGGGGSTVSVAADPSGQLAFEPTTLTATAGEVTIDFTNEASVPHDVVVERDGEDLGETEQITGSSTTTTIDLQAGEYTFYCSVPGHRDAGMEGTLTVE
jgi:plastocyanin